MTTNETLHFDWKLRRGAAMISRHDVRDRLRIAVEDRFIILRLREDKALLPESKLLDDVASVMGSFHETYNILCDWRGLHDITSDVTEFVDVLCQDYGATVLALPSETTNVRDCFGSEIPILQVSNRRLPVSYSEIDLTLFREGADWQKYFRNKNPISNALPTEDEWELVTECAPYIPEVCRTYEAWLEAVPGYLHVGASGMEGGEIVLRKRYVERLLERKGRNSLLTEFAIQVEGDKVLVTPYHAHALHSIEASNQLLVGRPGVIASKTGALFSQEISQFEQVLCGRKTKEASIQTLLEHHPNLFKVLGYKHVYPQVVLQRSDGSSLRPDFILEPVEQDWCDILDIKVPQMKTIVGSRDRKTFSAYIHELAAQLREYAAYFEDEKLSKRIEQIYGIKCYKPRLIGVIGRDPKLQDERQLRRLMTAYTDLSIITFDQLLNIAKSRLLI